jgi:hypothetical protein
MRVSPVCKATALAGKGGEAGHGRGKAGLPPRLQASQGDRTRDKKGKPWGLGPSGEPSLERVGACNA